MRRGRPRKIRFRKRIQRRKFGAAARGFANPSRRAAARARNRVRRNRKR